jgi:flagellar hook protein FlgE
MEFTCGSCFMEISGNAFRSGISTIQSGQRRVDQAAAEIAGNSVAGPQQPAQTPAPNQVNQAPETSGQNRADLTESMVALRVGQNEAQVGARVVRTADEVLGTLIDTKA